MRRPELDYILSTMLDSAPEVSDLIFTVDKPLQVEAAGELTPVACDPTIEKLTPFQTEMIALNLVGENQWNHQGSPSHRSCDAALYRHRQSPIRINIFSQRGNYSIVLRKLTPRYRPWKHSSSRDYLSGSPGKGPGSSYPPPFW